MRGRSFYKTFPLILHIKNLTFFQTSIVSVFEYRFLSTFQITCTQKGIDPFLSTQEFAQKESIPFLSTCNLEIWFHVLKESEVGLLDYFVASLSPIIATLATNLRQINRVIKLQIPWVHVIGYIWVRNLYKSAACCSKW